METVEKMCGVSHEEMGRAMLSILTKINPRNEENDLDEFRSKLSDCMESLIE